MCIKSCNRIHTRSFPKDFQWTRLAIKNLWSQKLNSYYYTQKYDNSNKVPRSSVQVKNRYPCHWMCNCSTPSIRLTLNIREPYSQQRTYHACQTNCFNQIIPWQLPLASPNKPNNENTNEHFSQANVHCTNKWFSLGTTAYQ